MAGITISDFPAAEVMDKWVILTDVSSHFAADTDDVTAVVTELGGQAADNISMLACLDPGDIKDAIAQWARDTKGKPMKIIRYLKVASPNLWRSVASSVVP